MSTGNTLGGKGVRITSVGWQIIYRVIPYDK